MIIAVVGLGQSGPTLECLINIPVRVFISNKMPPYTALFGTTVEPLSNDHPHQRPSLSYDHISCDGQYTVCIRIPHERPSPLYDHTNVILRVVI